MLADIRRLYVTDIGTKVKHETRTMHLFAGHGGGLLADLILGHTPVVAVEWDGYACQVLRERAADGWFPGLRVWEGDVRLFDPSEYAVEHGLQAFPKSKEKGSRRNLIDGKAPYITKLIDAGLIEVHENGWIVIEPGMASGMMLKK